MVCHSTTKKSQQFPFYVLIDHLGFLGYCLLIIFASLIHGLSVSLMCPTKMASSRSSGEMCSMKKFYMGFKTYFFALKPVILFAMNFLELLSY